MLDTLISVHNLIFQAFDLTSQRERERWREIKEVRVKKKDKTMSQLILATKGSKNGFVFLVSLYIYIYVNRYETEERERVVRRG